MVDRKPSVRLLAERKQKIQLNLSLQSANKELMVARSCWPEK